MKLAYRFGCQKMYPTNFRSQKSLGLLLCLKCISTVLKMVNDTLKLHKKVTVAESQKHDIMINKSFLIHHLCTVLLDLNSINCDHKNLQNTKFSGTGHSQHASKTPSSFSTPSLYYGEGAFHTTRTKKRYAHKKS